MLPLRRLLFHRYYTQVEGGQEKTGMTAVSPNKTHECVDVFIDVVLFLPLSIRAVSVSGESTFLMRLSVCIYYTCPIGQTLMVDNFVPLMNGNVSFFLLIITNKLL